MPVWERFAHAWVEREEPAPYLVELGVWWVVPRRGKLLYIVTGIPRGPLRRKAWEIFDWWQEEEITFREAKRWLEELANRAKG